MERFCLRLGGQDLDADCRLCFAQLINDYCFLGATRRPVLRADACDLLEVSAGVDPLVHVDPDHAKILRDGSLLFPGLAPGTVSTGRMNESDKKEYAKLVVRQLRANKVTLSDACHASETVFPVGKSNGQLREVWCGHTLSQHAIAPPKPPHIANPATLVFLESSIETPIYLYKRDARCFFDQLAIPAEIQRWFGRPRLNVSEMIKYGDISLDELRSYWCGSSSLSLDTIAHPLCLSWPMGFAWSSFLAQSTLLSLCLRGGLKLSQILSSDRVTPKSTRCNFALATDDLMIFGRGNQSGIKHRLARVDKAIKDGGVQRHPGKDEDEKASGTAVGIDLDQGLFLAPHAPKICKLVNGLTHFLRDQPLVAVEEVQAIIGHLTWFALLNRLTFSCFCDIYDACGRLTDVRGVAEPSVFFEIALFCSLFPWLEADLTRPWQRHVIASDASKAYGFGVAVAHASEEVVRNIGRFGARPRTFVRLDRSVPYIDDEAARPRSGRKLAIPLSKSSFKTVISSRARHVAHSSTLEAHAVALALRWTLRSTSRHSRRTVLLIDATAVCGAVAKGRSSSPCLGPEIRRIAALGIAGDLLLRIVYVPSEDNPGDAPSRGVVRAWATGTSWRHDGKVRKRHIKQGYNVYDDIHRLTRTGSTSSRNKFRRLFRKCDWSDVSSLSSLDSDCEGLPGGASL